MCANYSNQANLLSQFSVLYCNSFVDACEILEKNKIKIHYLPRGLHADEVKYCGILTEQQNINTFMRETTKTQDTKGT